MSHPVLPPVPPLPAEPDDLDRLFSAYFKKELPSQWPACPVARSQPSGLVRSGSTSRSRLTLAASVAALLGLGLYASSGSRPQFSDPSPTGPGMFKDSKASDPNLKNRMDGIESGNQK